MCNSNKKGKVYLVGAGPGDENLLTVKAVQLLSKADVVVYDRLISQRILDGIPESAEMINVGKNVGNHPVPQDEINQILLEKALENKLVVRLKGGDPFLFGRGGEELELLAENGIPFEVVPGVTSAIAAAAYAGIPITHRDFCSSLHIITGHAKRGSALNLDYQSLVKLGGTLVFMMSVSSIDEIASGLIQAGMSFEMPTAVIENGTLSNQRNFVSTLSGIGSVIAANNVQSPATIVVGKVCELASRFEWFTKMSLHGCKVIVTRPQLSASKLSSKLVALGATVCEYPCIKTASIEFAISLDSFNWIVFTSQTGVQSFFEQLKISGKDSRALYGKKIAAVGTKTAEQLSQHGIISDYVSTVFDGKHLAEELIKSGLIHPGEKAVLYRAKIGSNEIITLLEAHGVDVADIAVYETEIIKNEKIEVGNYDCVTFTSASCVSGFISSIGKMDFTKINALCIGEQTAKAAIEAGMNVVVSDEATIDSMVQKLEGGISW